jgi:hypothetical protein
VSTITFRARGSLDPDLRMQLATEGAALARSRVFWCGAPCVLVERWRDGRKSKLRVSGTLELSFDWREPQFDRAAVEDDAFMASRELRAIVDWLALRHAALGVEWDVVLPMGKGTARIDRDGAGRALSFFGEELAREGAASGDEARDAERAAQIVERHRRRHANDDGPWIYTSRDLGALSQYRETLRARIRLTSDAEQSALVAATLHARSSGRVLAGVFAVDAIDDVARAREIVDRAAIALDLMPIGVAWREIPRSEAEGSIANLLHRDMAYKVVQAGAEDARVLAARWLSSFDASAQCFANGSWDAEFNGGYTPIGTATFDAAIAIASPDRVALLWVGDED